MSELLPCPFCGGEAKVNKWEGGFKVLCQKVFCAVLGPYNTEQEAIDAWNTRTEMSQEDIAILLDELGISERTCHNTNSPNTRNFICSECGESYPKAELTECPNYCPSCGLKVVE